MQEVNLKIGDAFFYFNPLDPDLWSDVDWKRKIRKYVVTGLCHEAWNPGDTQIRAEYSKRSNPHFLWTSFFGKSCFMNFEDALASLKDAGFELSEVEE